MYFSAPEYHGTAFVRDILRRDMQNIYILSYITVNFKTKTGCFCKLSVFQPFFDLRVSVLTP